MKTCSYLLRRAAGGLLAVLLAFLPLTPTLGADARGETGQAAERPVEGVAGGIVENGIEKSPNDPREYRFLTLDNGLKVLLVSDPAADKAAAALDVGVGSNGDPDQYPGLAHFLEHMLFLGTDKYPEAGEYQDFITSHGGSHNAYTAFENTNYYFDIEPGQLAPALDRFARFFIAPRFDPAYVERERNAVHSEYQSHREDDGRRGYSIFKQVLNPAHPLSRFSVGSLDTLPYDPEDQGEGLREALLELYHGYYSADLMSLSILGRESLDELEALARRHFAEVPDRDASRPAHAEPLFAPGSLPALVRIKPVRDTRTLSYTFPLPPVHPHYREKPLGFLGHLLGHEGEGSLFSLLRERGWANGLSAGAGMSYRNEATFSLTVALTEAGVERIDEISALVFQTIEQVRDAGISAWRYDEQGRMAELGFLFQEPAEPRGLVSTLARRLQDYPAAEVLSAPYAYARFDEALIKNLLAHLRPDNLLLTVTHPDVETDRRDALFGGEYAREALPPARLAAWREAPPAAGLAMPSPNPFLPEDLTVKDVAEQPVDATDAARAKPELVLDEARRRLWFMHDDTFNVPRANFHLYAKTPAVNDSLRAYLLSVLAVGLVNDKLNEYAYPARLAGVYYGVARRSRGISLSLGGYNDKQDRLLEAVLETLVEADFDPARFDIIKTELVRGWRNAAKQKPYTRLFQEMQGLLVDPHWTEAERIAAIADIELADVEAFVPRMLSGMTLEGLYHGNVTREEALALMDLAGRYLGPGDQAEAPPFGRILDLGAGERVVQRSDVEHDDSAIVIYLQGPDDALETRAVVNLLGTLIRTPFYDTLRTEQQLGYVVNAGTMPLLKTNGLLMYIESPGTDPAALEGHIDTFLADFEARLADMPAERFAAIKAGLLNDLREKPRRLSELSGRFWRDILLESYRTDSTLAMADAVEALDREAVLAYYRRYVRGDEAARLVSWSVGRPHREAFAAAPRAEADARIEGVDQAFKAGADFFLFRSEDTGTDSGGPSHSARSE